MSKSNPAIEIGRWQCRLTVAIAGTYPGSIYTRAEQLIPLMSRRWGEAFTLGGLAGLPFAGKSGFAAYFHHVPVDGKLLIMFAPHVGIGPLGKIGALQRNGQDSISSACGAAIGAYKELQKKAFAPVDPNAVLDLAKDEDADAVFDPQLKTIVDLLKPRIEGIESYTDSIAFVTYQMYGIIRELLYGILDQTPDLFQDCSEGTSCLCQKHYIYIYIYIRAETTALRALHVCMCREISSY